MGTQFFYKNKDRWKKVKISSTINGIDYLEVSPDDQTQLTIYFLHNLPGQAGGIPSGPVLTKDNIFIEGGVRVKTITVSQDPVASGNKLTVVTDQAGDFSVYTLSIVKSAVENEIPPDGFDQQLSEIDFSFKINCPNDFDCKTDNTCPPENTDEPSIDYLAKDYASFTRLMLDRMSVLMPDWRERNAADLQIALVEMLAYVGDYLSYYQDAVATEAYLNTARRRVSLRRHARLLDYFVHDGCNARAWVFIETSAAAGPANIIKKGTVLMTGGKQKEAAIDPAVKDKFLQERMPVVFETMHSIALNDAHNQISFYTWQDADCCLAKGATTATFKYSSDITLNVGDVLVFEELYGPLTGKKADADPTHRHAVRIQSIQKNLTDNLTQDKLMQIQWYSADALPFALCISSPVENEDKAIPLNEKSIARGNIVLADQGISEAKKSLIPDTATDANYNPKLPANNITVAAEYEHSTAKTLAAAVALKQDPHAALPVVNLQDGFDVWTVQRDLLESDRFASEFVVETDQAGSATLRFGDDVSGRQVLSGFSPALYLRTGNGKAGNVGKDTINTILISNNGIKSVRNPLDASGGTDAETMEEVRQFAPQAFRRQERAVTEADYVAKAELHPEVQKAAARFYWTGSWYTVYIIIDRIGGKDIDDAFKNDIEEYLEQYRMAGYDLEIRSPQYVPLKIVLNVCVKPGYFRSDIRENLLQVFSNADLPDGTRGFFHPDNFSFGQPVYLSALYSRAMQVTGVASVEIKTFQRWAKNPAGEIEKGLLQPADLEVLRLDNDPSLPENGKIDFIMLGGL